MSFIALPRLALALVLGGALAVAACSSAAEDAVNGPGDAGGAPQTSIEGTLAIPDGDGGTLDTKAVSHIYARSFCEFAERCYPLTLHTSIGDVDTCIAKYGEDAEARLIAKGVDITKADLDKCAASAAKRSCGDRYEDAVECRFKGKLADGAGCVHGLQCASGACARPNGGCGVCKPPVGVGEDCSNATCDANLLCTVERRCVKFGDADDACDSAKQLFCKSGLSCVSSKCTKSLALGATCTLGAGNPLCGVGTTCVEGTCKDTKVAKVGETCGVDPTTKAVTVCATSQCIDGTCAPLAKAGESCSYTGPAPKQCEYGAGCLPQAFPADAGSVCTFFPSADPNDCR